MGMTLAEKIIARAAGRGSVSVGEVVIANVDLAALNDLSGPLALDQFLAAGAKRVFDPDRIAFFAGRHMPFHDVKVSAGIDRLRRFAEEQGIKHFYAGGEGMDHALMPEYGMALPGRLICDGDSHTCTAGALTAFGVPMGSTDMAYVLAFGQTWLRVPSSLRVTYGGVRQPYVTSKDFVLATLGQIGVDGGRYKSIEFGGTALASLTIDERLTITNMGIEMGAKTALMETDQIVMDYLATRTSQPVVPLSADQDAVYEDRFDIDVSTLPPLVAKPHLPSNIAPAADLRAIRVTQVNLGSCTNGRMVDLEQAAELMRGNKVAKGVRFIVTPPTNIVYRQALKAGLIEAFVEAGAIVNPPGCGACAGWHMGVLNADDICLSTHNRNFRGRMGSRDAQIYLASPYVAAATAITGVISDPKDIRWL